MITNDKEGAYKYELINRVIYSALDIRAAKSIKILCLLLILSICQSPAYSQPPSNPMDYIEKVYDIILNVPDGEQDGPIEKFLEKALDYRADHPENVEIWIACALAHLVYGGDRTNLIEQRSLFKTTRHELETAIDLDKRALGGLASASLGRIYNMLPPWPFSYGSKRKAEKLLKEALEIDSESAPNNYYYALFLISKDYSQAAKPYLMKAKLALPRPNLPNWDALLLRDIDKALAVMKAAATEKG